MRRIFIVLFVFFGTVVSLGNNLSDKDTTEVVKNKDFKIEVFQHNGEYGVWLHEKQERLNTVSNPFEGQVPQLHEACMEEFIPIIQDAFPEICEAIDSGDLYRVRLLVRCDDQRNTFKGCQLVARSRSLEEINFFVKEITEGNRLMDAINKATEYVYRKISFISREELDEDKRKKLEDGENEYYWIMEIAINKDNLLLYGRHQ